MEKFMDHYGNVAAERKLRTPGSERRPAAWWRHPSSSMASSGWPAASGVEASGGVRARAWQAAAGMQQAASRLVAASELEHGKLRLASSKVPASRLVAASELEHGKLRLSRSNVRGSVSGTRDRRWWRRPRRGSHAAAPQQQGVCGSVAEAGVGVRAANGNLPLPSRQFKTPEVGRSWRY
ncbi:hypothetical protein PR003_g29594 [Phytophthora rubi]|uniref:Uncharacterized protein n=1 Tax=Phytophthora rubi TaxID=129364 RepID=A0A6A4BGC2_9STRA|nr:hypothetical protein PR003_g29594 [Phytophthora rubi]